MGNTHDRHPHPASVIRRLLGVDVSILRNASDDTEHALCYTVTVARPGLPPAVAPWYQGRGLSQPPSPDEVLQHLAEEADSVADISRDADYDEYRRWAPDYGLDPDSLSGYESFQATVLLRERLRRLLTTNGITALTSWRTP